MPPPDNDPDVSGKSRRRHSHFRRKRKDNTTKLVRVPRGTRSDNAASNPQERREPFADVVNDAPALPDPILQRPVPPPAPLPAERPRGHLEPASWLDDQQRRKRVEDTVGAVGLAILVSAMLVAMWLRMTGP